MIQLIYASQSKLAPGRGSSELNGILRLSEARNQAAGVSGYLICDGRSFFQVLEGQSEAVKTTFARIHADPRHAQIRVLAERNIATRSFPEWSMGGWMRTPETLGLFLLQGFRPDTDRSQITAAMVLALAVELRDFAAYLQDGARLAG